VYVPDLPGFYHHTPAWPNPHRWHHALDQWAASRAGQRACAGHHIAPDTVLRVAAALADYADHDTGRRCAPAQATLAELLDCSVKTIERAENTLQAAGFLHLIHGTGNYTPAMHRQYARLRKAGHQLVKPAHCPRVRALTLPRHRHPAGDHVVLPALSRSSNCSYCDRRSPNARIRAREAAARPQNPQRKPGWWRQAPLPLDLQQLAAALVARLPWLARNRHIAAVCDALSWNQIQPSRWGKTPTQAADQLLNQLAQTGPIPTGDSCRNPLGWLHHTLQQRINTDQSTPYEHQHTARNALHTQQRQQRAQTAADQAAAIPLHQSSAATSIRLTLAHISRPGRDLLAPSSQPSPRAWRNR
jgi:hypothetical protein